MNKESHESIEFTEAREVIELGGNVTSLETIVLLAKKGGLPFVQEVLKQ